jgi:hypothetical protein
MRFAVGKVAEKDGNLEEICGRRLPRQPRKVKIIRMADRYGHKENSHLEMRFLAFGSGI